MPSTRPSVRSRPGPRLHAAGALCKAALAVAVTVFVAGCAAPFTAADVPLAQPPIVVDRAPERPLKGSYSLYNNTRKVGLAALQPLVPAYAGAGRLLASWNPHPRGVAGRPTFVVVHGGHGLVPTNFATALWLRDALGANVMVLDSYWSRGREENWATWTAFGANMRALDAIAAARWLRDTAAVDPARIFLYGDSQGGWTVLRTIVIPHAAPGITAGCIVVFMLTLGNYLTASLLGGKNSLWFTEQIYTQFITRFNWEQGAAFGFLLLLLSSLMVWIGLRLSGQKFSDVMSRT